MGDIFALQSRPVTPSIPLTEKADPLLFAALVGYIERAEIRPCVALRFPLSQIAAAQQAFLAKNHVGKIVLEV
jgi:NADPH:quinone reductase-like Zn-dependent oxidoreductase